jgi:hypothetical protein
MVLRGFLDFKIFFSKKIFRAISCSGGSALNGESRYLDNDAHHYVLPQVFIQLAVYSAAAFYEREVALYYRFDRVGIAVDGGFQYF